MVVNKEGVQKSTHYGMRSRPVITWAVAFALRRVVAEFYLSEKITECRAVYAVAFLICGINTLVGSVWFYVPRCNRI